MLEVFVIAVALSMDAFAVSLGLGAKKVRRQAALAFVAALYFGLFQGLMPLLGFWGGKHVLGIVADYANWIAFFLLLAIGAKMIYESFFDNGTETQITKINQRVLFILAIATSIDAMAAGFTLNLLSFSPLLACVIIAVTTFLFSVTGVYIGAKSGTWLENKAELFGGVVLILIGVKVLMRI